MKQPYLVFEALSGVVISHYRRWNGALSRSNFSEYYLYKIKCIVRTHIHLLNHLFNDYIVASNYYWLAYISDWYIQWLTDSFMAMLSNSLKSLIIGMWKDTSKSPGANECLLWILNTYSQVCICQLHPLYNPRAFASWWSWMLSSDAHSHKFFSIHTLTYGEPISHCF